MWERTSHVLATTSSTAGVPARATTAAVGTTSFAVSGVDTTNDDGAADGRCAGATTGARAGAGASAGATTNTCSCAPSPLSRSPPSPPPPPQPAPTRFASSASPSLGPASGSPSGAGPVALSLVYGARPARPREVVLGASDSARVRSALHPSAVRSVILAAVRPPVASASRGRGASAAPALGAARTAGRRPVSPSDPRSSSTSSLPFSDAKNLSGRSRDVPAYPEYRASEEEPSPATPPASRGGPASLQVEPSFPVPEPPPQAA